MIILNCRLHICRYLLFRRFILFIWLNKVCFLHSFTRPLLKVKAVSSNVRKPLMTSINFRYSYPFRSSESQVTVYKKVVRNCPNIKMLKQRLSLPIFSNSWYFFFLLLNKKCCLTPSLPECLVEFCKATLTFESADEILWCDHSNESSSPVLSHENFEKQIVVFQNFRKRNLESWLKFAFGHIWQWKG